PAAAQQIHDLAGGKKGWLQGYYSLEAAVTGWEHAIANGLVTEVEDQPASASTSQTCPTSCQRSSCQRRQELLGNGQSFDHLPSPRPQPSQPASKSRQAHLSPQNPRCQRSPHSRAPASSHRPPAKLVSDDEDMFLSDSDDSTPLPPPSPPSDNDRFSTLPSVSPRLGCTPASSSTCHVQPFQAAPSPPPSLRPSVGPLLSTLSANRKLTNEECHWVVEQ
ncbi:hypothetical protein C0992_011337, partial [Termitomyces sp. T32_za158]